MVKDYYRILEIDPAAGEEEVKKSYRRLAFKHHPDKNPGNRRSEERFKEIAEAYSILIDKSKRSDYDASRGRPFRGYSRPASDFEFKKEDFFRDMFHNAQTADFFSELEREFKRQGFRFNESFFSDLFSQRRNVFFGGIYYRDRSGSRFYRFGRKTAASAEPFGRRMEDDPPPPPLKRLSGVVTAFIKLFLPAIFGSGLEKGRDLRYRIKITRLEALRGKEVRFTFQRGRETEKLAVRIPPGIKDGAKLKLAGMGLPGDTETGPGDLFIEVKIT